MARTYFLVVEAALIALAGLAWIGVRQRHSLLTRRLQVLAVCATLSPVAGLGLVVLSYGRPGVVHLVLAALVILGGIAALAVIVELNKRN